MNSLIHFCHCTKLLTLKIESSFFHLVDLAFVYSHWNLTSFKRLLLFHLNCFHLDWIVFFVILVDLTFCVLSFKYNFDRFLFFNSIATWFVILHSNFKIIKIARIWLILPFALKCQYLIVCTFFNSKYTLIGTNHFFFTFDPF